MAVRGFPLPKLGSVAASRLFLILALLSPLLAALAVTALDPWAELRRLLAGILRPDLLSIGIKSVVWTVAFAVLGIGLGASAGLALAVVFTRSARGCYAEAAIYESRLDVAVVLICGVEALSMTVDAFSRALRRRRRIDALPRRLSAGPGQRLASPGALACR